MKRAAALLSLMLWLTTIAACGAGSGKKAENLDRATALAMLKENADKLYKPDECSLFLSWEFTASTPENGPEWNRVHPKRTFYGDLMSAGLLKDEKEVVGSPSIHQDDMMRRTKSVSYVYSYTQIDQPGVKGVIGECMYTNAKCVVLTLNKPSVGEVTGIKQEGTEAIVEAKVSYVPTPIYAPLYKAFTDAYKRPGGMWNPLSCGSPILDGASRTVVKPFKFVRYDDGWRLKTGYTTNR